MTFVRTTLLMAALQWRRFENRLESILGKKGTQQKSGTARRSGLGIVLMLFLALLFGFQSILLTSDFLKEASFTLGPLRDSSERIEVSSKTYGKLQELSAQNVNPSGENSKPIDFTDDGFGVSSKRAAEWAQIVQKQFNEKGIEGFILTEAATGTWFLPILSVWQHPEAGPSLIKTVGVLLLVISLMRFCMLLGTSQDLGKVEWQSEWFFTLPIPSQHLFGAQILGAALIDPISWVVTLPVLFSVFISADFGAWTLPCALFGMLYLGVLVAALRVAAETQLRKKLSPMKLKNLQALFSISGSVLYFWLFYISKMPATVQWLVAAVGKIPLALALNPFSLPSLACGSDAALVLVSQLGIGVASVWAGSLHCARLVRHGLVSSPNAYSGTRDHEAPTLNSRGGLFPPGVIGKELRLICRDRNFFVQTFVVPLLIAAMQIFGLETGFGKNIVSNFQSASAFAYGLGAFVLLGSLRVLVVEGNSLWMLYSIPVSIHRIMLRKTLLWACLAVLYTCAALVVCGAVIGSVTVKSLVTGAQACAGIFIYAFIGAGIGILGSDPLETEVQRQIKISSVYLYMILASMYANALYAPSLWTKLGQLILSSLLAYALWQKVRDREPFLLDPVAAPPPRVSLSDGLIAALAFFVLQSVMQIILKALRFSTSSTAVLSFVLAGALVASFYLLLYRRTPAFFGRQQPVTMTSLSSGLGIGVMGGCLAGGVGLLFLLGVEHFPLLRQLGDSTASPLGNIHGWWLLLLVVIAAPVFEEFIFRGLLFQGMRRSFPLGISVFCSAAIFALCHPPIAVIPVFTAGVLAAWSYALSGRLVTSMALHATYNAIVVVVPLLFFTSTPSFSNGERAAETLHDTAFQEEVGAAQPLSSRLSLGKPHKGREEVVHFTTYWGGVESQDAKFELWVPSKLTLEYSALPSDTERFPWLAVQFQNQLEQGDILSGNDLGLLYLYGLGVEKDWAAARGYFLEPTKKKRWVGQRYLAELLLMRARDPEDARFAAELVTPMIEAKNWRSLWAVLRAHDLLLATGLPNDRLMADRLIRLCIDGLQPALQAPPDEPAERETLLERVESVTQSLLGNPNAEDLRLAGGLISQWLSVDSRSFEARLYKLRARVMEMRLGRAPLQI